MDFINLPVARPPSEVIPNFDHPKSQANVEYIGVGICLGVTLVLMLLRMYVKLAVTRAWGWDDRTCLMGFVLITAYAGVNFSMTGSGKPVGKHIWELKIRNLTKGHFQSLLASLVMFSAAAFFVHLSLFLLYLRLFKPHKWTRWLVYVGMLVSGLCYSAIIISYAVVLPPSPGQTNTDISWILHFAKKESFMKTLALIQGVFDIISNIYLLIIPIRSIFQLQLPMQRRFGVSSIFLIGILAISCSVATLFYRIKLLHKQDYTWFMALLWTLTVYSTAEICAGIICSCMPILKALFRGHSSHKSPLASLTAILSRFSLRSFRRPSISEQSQSFDRLNSDQVNNHIEGKLDNKTKSKSEFTKSNDVFLNALC